MAANVEPAAVAAVLRSTGSLSHISTAAAAHIVTALARDHVAGGPTYEDDDIVIQHLKPLEERARPLALLLRDRAYRYFYLSDLLEISDALDGQERADALGCAHGSCWMEQLAEPLAAAEACLRARAGLELPLLSWLQVAELGKAAPGDESDLAVLQLMRAEIGARGMVRALEASAHATEKLLEERTKARDLAGRRAASARDAVPRATERARREAQNSKGLLEREPELLQRWEMRAQGAKQEAEAELAVMIPKIAESTAEGKMEIASVRLLGNKAVEAAEIAAEMLPRRKELRLVKEEHKDALAHLKKLEKRESTDSATIAAATAEASRLHKVAAASSAALEEAEAQVAAVRERSAAELRGATERVAQREASAQFKEALGRGEKKAADLFKGAQAKRDRFFFYFLF
ncbi:hypothetical protein T492DRAFT_325350 [Pavlovales sp. CCMP2436]|nr:hypothetical protein T492DRAFT_325350 [Pavlovales sp. CCMP2436]